MGRIISIETDSDRIIAVDPSFSSTGIVWTLDHNRIGSMTMRSFSRTQTLAWIDCIRRILRELKKEVEPDLFLIEAPAFGAQGKATVSMGQLNGILRSMARVTAPKLLEISPMTWKRLVFGAEGFFKGRGKSTGSPMKKSTKAEKEIYIQWCADHYHHKFHSVDEVDAFYLVTAYSTVQRGLAPDNIAKRMLARIEVTHA